MENLNSELESSFGRRVFADYIKSKFEDLSLINTFDRLTALYFEVNSAVNISALRTVDDVYVKHYLDSVYPSEYFFGSCCDVGCGGGFPTLPLAITTKLDFTGLDSVGKKLALIKRAVAELGIKNVRPEYSRAEVLSKTEKRFDTVCARALADIDTALSFCAPLAKPHGKVILYRTQNDNEASEKTVTKYSLSLESVIDYDLPETDIHRRLFIYEKK